MASKAAIVSDIMTEVGKSSPDVQQRIEIIVGNVTIDVLSQNHGKFASLSASQLITVSTATGEYKLNADFNTAKDRFLEVNVSGDYVRDIDIVTDDEYYYRKSDTSENYPGNTYARIEMQPTGTSGRGFYMVFGATPEAVAYYRFLYYRKPTNNDTDLIQNEELVKNGVRAKLKDFYADQAAVELQIYLAGREKYRDDVSTRTTEITMRPAKRAQRLNRAMHAIGRGD